MAAVAVRAWLAYCTPRCGPSMQACLQRAAHSRMQQPSCTCLHSYGLRAIHASTHEHACYLDCQGVQLLQLLLLSRACGPTGGAAPAPLHVLQAESAYRVVLARYPTNVKLLRSYGRFLEGVVNDPWRAAKYFRCARYTRHIGLYPRPVHGAVCAHA